MKLDLSSFQHFRFNQLPQIMQQVWLVVREPAGDPRRAVLLLLLGVALLLLVGMGVGLMVSLAAESRRRAILRAAIAGPEAELEIPAQPARGRPQLTAGRAVVVLGVVVIALVAAYGITGTNAFCGAQCHSNDATVQAATKSIHANVTCVACHEAPLPTGLAQNAVLRISYAIAAEKGTTAAESSASVTVDESRCLSCHQNILQGTVTLPANGLKISHKEPLASGMRCDDCHSGYAHSAKLTNTGMSRCTPCHDGKQASSACSTCHVGDPAAAGVDFGPTATKVSLAQRDCTGCHSLVKCDACHGLRLPHSQQFINGGHARTAAFEGKQLCWRCHSYAFCSQCHRESFQNQPHGANWKVQHAVAAWSSPCGCHQGMSPGGVAPPKQFCKLCHTQAEINANPK